MSTPGSIFFASAWAAPFSRIAARLLSERVMVGTQAWYIEIFIGFSRSGNRFFDARVGNDPHGRHRDVDRARDPLVHESERDRQRVERHGNLALAIAPDRLGEERVLPMVLDQGPRQDHEGEAREQ